MVFYSSCSSSSDSSIGDMYQLPEKYKFLKVLGNGGFGVVLKCLDLQTNQTVAIKVALTNRNLNEEASMLKVLMANNLDQRSIIKFYYGFSMNKYLVFELLDISLNDFIVDRKAPMRLQDIKAVIQQLATAFDALKKIGVIHTDVKTANIMLVDRVRRPYVVKLIDFGLAIFKSTAKNVKVHQTPFYRAPEIMLGLPFSEAIDMWSLGCVMGIMVCGFALFTGRNNYTLLRDIVALLGPPPDHVILAGWRTRQYFKRKDSNQMLLKTPEQYWGSTQNITNNRLYPFRCLDDMKTMCLEKNNKTEADERRECIELLKAMLQWDEQERITPSEILDHSFITMSYLCSSTYFSSCNALMSAAAESSTSQADKPGTSQAPIRKHSIFRTYVNNKLRATYRVHPAAVMLPLPSGCNIVQPDPPLDRPGLEDKSEETNSESYGWTSISQDSIPAAAAAHTAVEPANRLDNAEEGRPKRRKMKCLRRFFSWRKGTVCSCCNVDVKAE